VQIEREGKDVFKIATASVQVEKTVQILNVSIGCLLHVVGWIHGSLRFLEFFVDFGIGTQVGGHGTAVIGRQLQDIETERELIGRTQKA